MRKTKVAGGELLAELVLGEGDEDEYVQLAGAEGDVVVGEDVGDEGGESEDELVAAVMQISLDSEEVVFNSGLEAV